MAEESKGAPTRPRIEILSDLIFGLALSIGALSLIGQQPSGFQQLVLSIVYYGFSFLILVSIWRLYTRTMSLLPNETNSLINLNLFLLFLVSIEPYLFNQLINAHTLALALNVSTLYALDIGGLFSVLTVFTNSLIGENKKGLSEQLLREYKYRRNTQLIVAVIFFVSAFTSLRNLEHKIEQHHRNTFKIPNLANKFFLARIQTIAR